jgi:hypothetical protein
MQAETFSLAKCCRMFIKTLLLDRFLACMKPASITLRQPCAGVFFWLIEIMGWETSMRFHIPFAGAA